jgi:hypothetical protein
MLKKFILKIKENLETWISLTYGEILPKSVRLLIHDINSIDKIDKTDVFCDLGSGTGKVCLQFLEETNIEKSCGIELNRKRYNKSIKLKKKYSNSKKKLFYIHSNFINVNISDATIIFTNSIMFSNRILNIIEKKSFNCKKLKFLISMKPLNPKFLKLIKKRLNIPVTWGKSEYYIYSK